MVFYTSLINRLHNLKAVVRTMKLSVVAERGTYRAIYNDYRIIEHNLQSGSRTDRKCMKV